MAEIGKKLQTFFKQEKDILFVYLFGSQVRKKTNYESDVDLAIYLDEKKIKDYFKKRLYLIEAIQSILKKTTEVVILNETRSILLKFVIIKEGKIIFEKDHKVRVDFELKTMQEYYDFQPFLEAYNKAYLERLQMPHTPGV